MSISQITLMIMMSLGFGITAGSGVLMAMQIGAKNTGIFAPAVRSKCPSPIRSGATILAVLKTNSACSGWSSTRILRVST